MRARPSECVNRLKPSNAGVLDVVARQAEPRQLRKIGVRITTHSRTSSVPALQEGRARPPFFSRYGGTALRLPQASHRSDLGNRVTAARAPVVTLTQSGAGGH